jgi:folate-binding protein YgfZ
MTIEGTLAEQVAVLEQGRAFVVRSGVRLLRVSGADARGWLQDLLTADVGSLEPRGACRSLLLTATGRLRADLHVYAMDDASVILAQDDDQPEAVGDALAPYVLSSDVRLEAADRRAISAPGGSIPGDVGEAWSPSALGGGFDLLATDPTVAVRALRAAGRVEVGPEAVERWRILRGRARFPVDLDRGSLPAEAGLEGLIDPTKGCFLGQEAVAKVRNLGHPPRVILALVAEGPLTAGELLLDDGREVGIVTSAVPDGTGSAALARVRWDARETRLRTASGTTLRAR